MNYIAWVNQWVKNSLNGVTEANFIIKWKGMIYNDSIGFFLHKWAHQGNKNGYKIYFPKENDYKKKSYFAKKSISENKVSVNIPYSIVLVLETVFYFGID